MWLLWVLLGGATTVMIGRDWQKEVTNLTSPTRAPFNGKGVDCWVPEWLGLMFRSQPKLEGLNFVLAEWGGRNPHASDLCWGGARAGKPRATMISIFDQAVFFFVLVDWTAWLTAGGYRECHVDPALPGKSIGVPNREVEWAIAATRIFFLSTEGWRRWIGPGWAWVAQAQFGD